MSVGYHLTFRLRDSREIASDVRARRRLARSFLEIGDRYGLLAFHLSGDHAHGTFACGRAAAGDAAQAIGSSITQALGLPDGFNFTYLKPIEDQEHLEECFAYDHGQAKHHAQTDDPLRDGSSLPDLLGLRVLGTGIEERVTAHLPAAAREALRVHLGVGPAELVFAPRHLADAAAGVFALGELRGRSDAHVMAKAAAVQVAVAQMKTDAVGRLLGCSKTTTNRLRRVDVPREVILAVRRGMALRSALGKRLTAAKATSRGAAPRAVPGR